MTEDLRESPNSPGMDPKKNPPDLMPWAIVALALIPFVGVSIWFLFG